jgi:hypothetical protein
MRNHTAMNGDISLTAVFMEANDAAHEKTHSASSALALRGEITQGASIDRRLMFFTLLSWGLRGTLPLFIEL